MTRGTFLAEEIRKLAQQAQEEKRAGFTEEQKAAFEAFAHAWNRLDFMERAVEAGEGASFVHAQAAVAMHQKADELRAVLVGTDTQMQYIIWSPEGRTPPRVRFDTRDKAQQEAERLAAQCPGQQFFVCALVSVSKTTTVQTEQLGGVSGDSVGVKL